MARERAKHSPLAAHESFAGEPELTMKPRRRELLICESYSLKRAWPGARKLPSHAANEDQANHRRSEREPRTKAPLARLVRTIQTGDVPEIGVVDVAGRVGEVRMVRSIQGFRAELKLHLFRDPERAEDAEIRLEEARTAKVISDSVAKDGAGLLRPGATCRAGYSLDRQTLHCICKPGSGGGAPLRGRPNPAQDSDVLNELVWNLTTSTSQQIRRTALNHIEWNATHQAHDAANLEAPENLALPAIFSPSLALTEGQVIHPVNLQVMRPVITGQAMVSLLGREELDSRTTVIVGKVLCPGPRISGSEL